MRHSRSLLYSLGVGMAFLASTIVVVAMAIAAPIFNLFVEAFPPDKAVLDRSADAPSTEIAQRMSQTGKAWDFVTDLFKREGRVYNWQAGDGLA